MKSKEKTIKINEIKTFNSNAEIFGSDKDNETYRFHIDFDTYPLIIKAKYRGLVQFRKAIIRSLRERYENIRFICPKHLI